MAAQLANLRGENARLISEATELRRNSDYTVLREVSDIAAPDYSFPSDPAQGPSSGDLPTTCSTPDVQDNPHARGDSGAELESPPPVDPTERPHAEAPQAHRKHNLTAPTPRLRMRMPRRTEAGCASSCPGATPCPSRAPSPCLTPHLPTQGPSPASTSPRPPGPSHTPHASAAASSRRRGRERIAPSVTRIRFCTPDGVCTPDARRRSRTLSPRALPAFPHQTPNSTPVTSRAPTPSLVWAQVSTRSSV